MFSSITKFLCLACAIGVLLSACDPIYPPFMRNGLNAPLRVRTVYSSGEITDDEWSPQMEVSCGRKEAQVNSMSVTLEGREIHHLDQNDIIRMTKSVKDMRKVIWEIRRNQIVPLPH
jgi:hypothetical protein